MQIIETFNFPMPPTLNDMIRSARGNKIQSAREKKKWTQNVANLCIGKHSFLGSRVWMEYVFRVKNFGRDQDNIQASKKFIFDGMVKAKVISDDNLTWIGGFSPEWFLRPLEGDGDSVEVRVSNLPILDGKPHLIANPEILEIERQMVKLYKKRA